MPYTSINNAARINAGLDIINTLQEIYQVKATGFSLIMSRCRSIRNE